MVSHAPNYASERSRDNGLRLNPNKCAQYMFSSKGNDSINLKLKSSADGSALSAVEAVADCGVAHSGLKVSGLF